MGSSLLPTSTNLSVCTNILRQVSFDYGIKLHEDQDVSDAANNNYLAMAPSSSSEITLPPINSIMKTTQSPNYNNLDFDNLILMAKHEQMDNFMDGYQMNLHEQLSTSSDSEKMNASPKNIKFTEMSESETQKFACELCARKYITKSNLEKHMRSHDLFMCVVCMKVS
jgi:Zinc-finger double-stranded RNA-binding